MCSFSTAPPQQQKHTHAVPELHSTDVPRPTIKMAKPLLSNHTNHHHPPLITLIKEEKLGDRAQCNLSAPPRLLFTPATFTATTTTTTPAATATSTSTSTTTTTLHATKRPTTTSSQDIKLQTILPVLSSSSAASYKLSFHSRASAASKKSSPLRHSLGRSSADVLTATGDRQAAKLNQQHSTSSVINRSAAAAAAAAATTATSGGGGGETGNVTARLLDMGKRLLEAARDGQTDHVRQLVVGSGAPFTSDWLGTTALHLAAQYGHAEIADILLRGGVNRDARTKLERTALHLAAQSGSLPVVESLLIHGSDINARDMLKMTPLHWAVERRHIDIVRRLLVGGADITARSKFLLTPLDIAQSSGYYEIVDLFKSWTSQKDDCDLGAYNATDNNQQQQQQQQQQHLNLVNNTNTNKFYESHDIFNDVNYQLMLAENGTASRGTSMLDIDEPCIDLVELEWSSLKFEADFATNQQHPSSYQQHNVDTNEANRDQKPCELECLMNMVEELQKENEQLRRRLEQVSTPPDEQAR